MIPRSEVSKLVGKPFIDENGWLNTPRLDDGGDNIAPLIVAIVPVVRLVALIGIWYMAFNKKKP